MSRSRAPRGTSRGLFLLQVSVTGGPTAGVEIEVECSPGVSKPVLSSTRAAAGAQPLCRWVRRPLCGFASGLRTRSASALCLADQTLGAAWCPRVSTLISSLPAPQLPGARWLSSRESSSRRAAPAPIPWLPSCLRLAADRAGHHGHCGAGPDCLARHQADAKECLSGGVSTAFISGWPGADCLRRTCTWPLAVSL